MFQFSADRSRSSERNAKPASVRAGAGALGVLSLVSLALVLSCSSCSGTERRPPPAPAASAPPPAPLPVPPPPAAEPALRADVASAPLGDTAELSVAEWHARHEALLSEPARSRAGIVVLGDSIAEEWCSSRAFTKKWSKHRPLNLALPGEQTQQLLWRIEHGALDGLSPRLVFVLLGAENLARGFAPSDTALGIEAVVRRVHQALPQAAILVLALLPAGESPSDPRRARIEAVNAALAELAASVAGSAARAADRIVVSDVGGTFLDADGTITAGVMEDFVRPTPLGYEALTLSLSLVAERLLGVAPRK